MVSKGPTPPEAKSRLPDNSASFIALPAEPRPGHLEVAEPRLARRLLQQMLMPHHRERQIADAELLGDPHLRYFRAGGDGAHRSVHSRNQAQRQGANDVGRHIMTSLQNTFSRNRRPTARLTPAESETAVFCQLRQASNSIASRRKPPVRCAASSMTRPTSASFTRGCCVQASNPSSRWAPEIAVPSAQKCTGRKSASSSPEMRCTRKAQ